MEIREVLIGWYRENRRDLPWRNTTDPYLIWISEIILQQTRVVQGLDYFNRFVSRFPDVKTLAEASEDEVLKYWEGLGYYSRARNLHAAARDIMARFNGVFPRDYKDVLSLKGIGGYTAAAVCSFAWKQPYAVVDGNVFRVLARLFDIDLPIDSGAGKKYFTELAQELLDKQHPDLYNQAIMDFGALQCVPQGPDCLFCPFRDVCRGYAAGKVDVLPVKEGKTVVKPRYFNYLYVRCDGRVLLARRSGKDIWQNLYEFPLIETSLPVDPETLQKSPEFERLFRDAGTFHVLKITRMPRHILSHRIIYSCFYEIQAERFSSAMTDYIRVLEKDVGQYALPRLLNLYLENERT